MNLIEALNREQLRVAELRQVYRALGPVGTFGGSALDAALEKSVVAMAGGDVLEMTLALNALKASE